MPSVWLFDDALQASPAMNLPSEATQSIGTPASVADSTSSTQASSRPRWMALAAGVLLAAGIGLVVGYRIASPGVNNEIKWHQAVVDYHQLYAKQTLNGAAPTVVQIANQLKRVSEQSGFLVSPEMVQLPGLAFRRAQVLEFQGDVLIQLAFSDASGQPVVLCYKPVSTGDGAAHEGRVNGMNIVTWERAGYGFILAAKQPTDLLKSVAPVAVQRF